MKKQLQKYVIVIDSQDIEAQNALLRKTLYHVGFMPRCDSKSINVFDCRFISVNEYVDGEYNIMTYDVNHRLKLRDIKVLLASYVIENIYELDGAKQLWEIPPEGYRIVSDDELRNARNPGSNINDIVRVVKVGDSANWRRPICFSTPGSWLSENGYIVAVPVDFRFETIKPWEIPEPGYRLVTDEERKQFEKPSCVRMYCKELKKWHSAQQNLGWCAESYAVPANYVFEEDVIEVTMADLERSYGKKVKIVK